MQSINVTPAFSKSSVFVTRWQSIKGKVRFLKALLWNAFSSFTYRRKPYPQKKTELGPKWPYVWSGNFHDNHYLMSRKAACGEVCLNVWSKQAPFHNSFQISSHLPGEGINWGRLSFTHKNPERKKNWFSLRKPKISRISINGIFWKVVQKFQREFPKG